MSDKSLTYASNSPLLKEMRKSPIMYIKHANYGVRKLQIRVKQKKKGIR
jgi:hypothetical protein